MVFTTFLLVFLVVSSTISALAFGIAGTAIYVVNLRLEFYQWGSNKQPGFAMLVGCLSQTNRRVT